eukprot:2740765-Amphidinium_carterae.1
MKSPSSGSRESCAGILQEQKEQIACPTYSSAQDGHQTKSFKSRLEGLLFPRVPKQTLWVEAVKRC